MFAAKAIFALTLAGIALAAPIVDGAIEERCVGSFLVCQPPVYPDSVANKRTTGVQARSIGELDHSNGWTLWGVSTE
ncbi:hypothetical protein DFH09DRAFT_1161359 [Mycena vulgaris]|nr:hypothetical protein DFH09DRAFT_1161359 [Mycena vulgaris]